MLIKGLAFIEAFVNRKYINVMDQLNEEVIQTVLTIDTKLTKQKNSVVP